MRWTFLRSIVDCLYGSVVGCCWVLLSEPSVGSGKICSVIDAVRGLWLTPMPAVAEVYTGAERAVFARGALECSARSFQAVDQSRRLDRLMRCC